MNIKIVAAGFAVASLALVGCSSNDDSTAEASPTAATSAPASPADGMTDEASAGTIVDVAAANPDFSTLVAAVTEAGLAETLVLKVLTPSLLRPTRPSKPSRGPGGRCCCRRTKRF